MVIEELKAWREKNGLSQRQAVAVMEAGGVPVTQRSLRGWETGERRPGAMAAKLLEQFLRSYPKVEVVDKGRYRKRAKTVSGADVKRIMELRAQEKTLREIGRQVGISESAVSRICAGNRHGASAERLAKEGVR